MQPHEVMTDKDKTVLVIMFGLIALFFILWVCRGIEIAYIHSLLQSRCPSGWTYDRELLQCYTITQLGG